jgi:hypothetical protein
MAGLLISIATFPGAKPLPLDSAIKYTVVARADMVTVTCPTLSNAGAVTYSAANIDDAFTRGTGLLLPPPDPAKGSNGMLRDIIRVVVFTTRPRRLLTRIRKVLPRFLRQLPEHRPTG